MLKHFKPLRFAEVQEIAKGSTVKYPSFFLSFDDGLRSFYEVAAPVLQRKGIEAACFVNSSCIDNKALFFRYKASLLIEELSVKNISPGKIS
ncbi:MAG: hypothetical protein EOP53_27470, partial [Sphingobacteriales bacterium]